MPVPDSDDIDRDVNVSSLTSAASGWTFGTLHLFFTEKIHSAERRVDLALHEADRRYAEQVIAQKEAIDKAEKSTNDRFYAVNEFRAALSDLSARMITRVDVDNRLNSIIDKINDMSARLDRSEGKGMGMATIWGIILGGAGLFSIVVTVMLNTFRVTGH